MYGNLEIYVARVFGRSKAINFFVSDCDIGTQKIYIAEPLVLTESPDSLFQEQRPTFSLDNDKAQTLMDRLWDCGLRPSEGTGSAGAMAAVQQHLKDLQKIVFKSYPQRG